MLAKGLVLKLLDRFSDHGVSFTIVGCHQGQGGIAPLQIVRERRRQQKTIGLLERGPHFQTSTLGQTMFMQTSLATETPVALEESPAQQFATLEAVGRFGKGDQLNDMALLGVLVGVDRVHARQEGVEPRFLLRKGSCD